MKHAYLIMAHSNFEQLEVLLSMLDYPENCIFLHIDKKASLPKSLPKLQFSKIVVLENRIDVKWGQVSQVECEIALLEKALSSDTFSYYHLLSGADLPIKSQKYIHEFFSAHQGKEFIGFTDYDEKHRIRLNYRYFKVVRETTKFSKFFFGINKLYIFFQKAFHYSRLSDETKVRKGSQWFSISDSLARYVVEKKEKLIVASKKAECPDELFLQTLVFNSSFYDSVFLNKGDGQSGAMRLIDWNRGTPYIWRLKDLEYLQKSEMLFARKFDIYTDKKIVEKISELFQN